MNLLDLPDDLLCRVLGGYSDGEVVVTLASCGSAAAAAVRANRAGILATWGRARVLADMVALFPVASVALEPSTTEWETRWMDGADTFALNTDLDQIHFLNPVLYGDVIVALRIPLTVERVQMMVGGNNIMTLHQPLLRVMAPEGATEVDVLPLTVGTGFPIAALGFHPVLVKTRPGACRVRASFASYQWGSTLRQTAIMARYRCASTTFTTDALVAPEWRVTLTPKACVDAFVVLVTPKHALATVIVRSSAGERTFPEEYLRAHVWRSVTGVWQGLQSGGHLLPVATRHVSTLDIRLGLHPGVDPAGVTAQIVTVERNCFNVGSGLGFMFHE